MLRVAEKDGLSTAYPRLAPTVLIPNDYLLLLTHYLTSATDLELRCPIHLPDERIKQKWLFGARRH